jgi:hypothetical protein
MCVGGNDIPSTPHAAPTGRHPPWICDSYTVEYIGFRQEPYIERLKEKNTGLHRRLSQISQSFHVLIFQR